ncbi:phosphatase PAP2 family protein [Candidatus Parcubacteria bacterium]|nr:phosphatase PAP2 family protein [Patescibacteria group bacterium]MCG2687113.1 phosphatase PAP2 family protein [Candidatus Parcubacteria bacterium]
MQYILNLDYQIFQAINSLSGKWQVLDWFGIFCAKYLIWIMFLVFVIWWIKLAKTRSSEDWPVEGKRKWLIFGSVGLPVVLSFFINQLLAMIRFRDRPFLNLNISKLVEPLSEKSFPSDHSAMAFAIAVAVYFHNKKLGEILLVLAFLVALGRVYTGVHYPIDVVAGAIVGTVLSVIFYKIYKKIK